MPYSKFTRIVFHLIGWLLFFSLIIGFTYNSPGGENVFQQLLAPHYLVFYFTYIFLFYLNTNLLMPRLWLEKKYIYYAGAIILLFLAIYFLKPFDHLLRHNRPPDQPPPVTPSGNNLRPMAKGGPRFDIISIILFVMTWSLSTALSIIKEWRTTLQKVSRAEADKVKAELAFLKAQINPHFLFNTLNNIYSLAITKNENTSYAVMKLSNIMRYVTDDATNDFVLLQMEIECINDYIELQRLRLSKKAEINFIVTGNTEDKQIAPLILMTFVENVFKYGISNHESSPVTIKISADEKTITFFSENKIFDHQRNIERTGIGIANTRQRLEHIYPNRHLLNIATENGIYSVILTVQL
jgi:two-component system LytT family sensor kinase